MLPSEVWLVVVSNTYEEQDVRWLFRASKHRSKLFCPPEPMNVLPASNERWKYLEVKMQRHGGNDYVQASEGRTQ
jgi:hypothetical protein